MKLITTIFKDFASDLRKLVLVLYALAAPVFLLLMYLQISFHHSHINPVSWIHFYSVVFLFSTAVLWVFFVAPSRAIGWIYPVSIVPIVCCVIAFISCKERGLTFVCFMIAPLLCASILFTLPVIIATWLSAFLSCFGVILVYSGHVDIAVENSIVFATISGLIAWVLYKKSDELRTTSNKWNSLFTSMSEGVLVQDPDCTITDCNPAAERIFGLSYQQMIGMKPCNFLCQLTFEDGRLFTQEHSPVLMVVRSNQPVGPLQVSFIRDGQRRWVRYSVEPIRHRNGIISKVVTSFHDTTEQINANTELKKSEERFKQLAEVFPETIFEADTEGNLTYVNKHGLECFGMSPDVQVRGLNLFQVVHTDAHALLKERMDERLAGKVGGYSEFKAVTTNRTVFEALAYTAPVKDESENIIGIRGFILDISDRKKMERTLIESEALLMCLFENLPVGVAISIRRLIPLNR